MLTDVAPTHRSPLTPAGPSDIVIDASPMVGSPLVVQGPEPDIRETFCASVSFSSNCDESRLGDMIPCLAETFQRRQQRKVARR
jgi:hypothetical protein